MKTTLFTILILCPTFFYAQTYNPQAAVEYADYWWDGRNTNNWIKDSSNFNIDWGYPYNNYNHHGGDCANFVSQCLRAGDWDLSAGTNGFGNGVDNRGCISGVNELMAHFSYKKVHFTELGIMPPGNQLYHTLGDPVLIRNADNTQRHSAICSYIDGKTNYYAAHSADYHRVRRQGYTTMTFSKYYHLSTPKHCFNCVKDEDEDEIDCGGSCPPCEHAPEERSYVTPTNNLPSEVRATKKITAGNAAVKVLSGQNVNFITAGTIELLPGFEAVAGSNFKTQIKNSSYSVTANCNHYCTTAYAPNAFFRHQDFLFLKDLVNVERVEYAIYGGARYHPTPGALIYNDIVYVAKEGFVDLWDLVTGESTSYLNSLSPGELSMYIADIWVYACMINHIPNKYRLTLYVFEPSNKLLNGPKETENPDLFLSSNIENIVLQNDNAIHHFSIIPNPNPGTFQLETTFPLTNIANLKITNLLGAPVYESQNLSSNTIQLPTSATGTFFVVIMLKDGSQLTQKMMIQR